MGLVLELKSNGSIYVGDTKIEIAIKQQYKCGVCGEKRAVTLYFEGPREVLILRGELVEVGGKDGARPKTTRRHR
ncbi:hypothetical protein LCGC14_0938930 [marine sediment metagenome]|uniref:Uncharacterized protein n=1 Tax=marine sediment metagenome TaxID=412755 RepID=A0A0F9NKQ2_9ZZZZ